MLSNQDTHKDVLNTVNSKKSFIACESFYVNLQGLKWSAEGYSSGIISSSGNNSGSTRIFFVPLSTAAFNNLDMRKYAHIRPENVIFEFNGDVYLRDGGLNNKLPYNKYTFRKSNAGEQFSFNIILGVDSSWTDMYTGLDVKGNLNIIIYN